MKIGEFLEKYHMSQREADICKSVYKEQEKTEEGWKKELTGKVIFSDKPLPKPKTKEKPEVSEAAGKIEDDGPKDEGAKEDRKDKKKEDKK